MTTNSPNNSFVEDGKLYLVPTLTSDVIGKDAVLDGHTFNITGCTAVNVTTGCGAVSNLTAGTVINPVMSARISTKNSHHIQYGRVEVRAKLPRGCAIFFASLALRADLPFFAVTGYVGFHIAEAAFWHQANAAHSCGPLSGCFLRTIRTALGH